MAIFSGYTLIRLLTAAHIFLGTLLILTPKRLTEQPIIFLLGEAVGLVSSYGPILRPFHFF